MFARRLALAVALLAGLLGSQAPEFAQQYRQRIGGALDELNRIITAFDAEAAQENVTPPQAIARLEQNSDPLARRRGLSMAETIARADRLREQLAAMTDAGSLKRLYVTLVDFDPELAQRTLDAYEPAAPLTFEALVAAGFAALWGWVAAHLIAWPFRRARRRREEDLEILQERARASILGAGRGARRAP
ncbi:MAG TPA: DUF2937 family protein [Roseiarcus sp.]|nr:DUF2937 family protein [Roseiarcus sp.]